MLVKTNYGNCYELENRWPSGIDTYETQDGFLVTFPALYILYEQGTKCDVDAGLNALDSTLTLIKKEFPNVNYYGYVGFVDCENVVHQKELASDEKIRVERYEFIAEAIGQINERLDEYIDNLQDSCYEEKDTDGKWVLDVVNAFHLYEDKVSPSIYNMIMSTVCEYIEDDDVYDIIEDKISEWKEEAGYVDPDDEVDSDEDWSDE